MLAVVRRLSPTRLRAGALLSAASACALLTVALASGDPLPPLPGGQGGVAPTSTIPPPGVDYPDAAVLLDHARRGVVTLEQGGRAIGLGTVLGSDPRILTALSALGAADTCDVRYADGRTVRARIGHKDAAQDLALLIPLAGRYADGPSASEADPLGVELRTFVVGAQNRPATQAMKVKGRTEARAKDGTPVSAVLDLDAKTPLLPGAPLVDGSGNIVGVVVRECRVGDAGACAPISVAQPVAAIRGFLVRTPVNAVPPSPWLGIQGSPDSSTATPGVRVLATAPGGSASQPGGLKPNDLIVSVDGEAVTTPERLQELIAKHAVGDTVKLHVMAGAAGKDVSIVLRAAP